MRGHLSTDHIFSQYQGHSHDLRGHRVPEIYGGQLHLAGSLTGSRYSISPRPSLDSILVSFGHAGLLSSDTLDKGSALFREDEVTELRQVACSQRLPG